MYRLYNWKIEPTPIQNKIYIAGTNPLLIVIGSKLENRIEIAIKKATRITIESIVTEKICDRFSPTIEINFRIYIPQRIASFNGW
jgi:hypothetical protein